MTRTGMVYTREGGVPLPADQAERLAEAMRLAFFIADETEKAAIQSWGRPMEDGWYLIAPWRGQEPYHAERLVRAAKYLSLRGELEVDTSDPQVVRVRV